MKLSLNTEQGAALAALADGIIPADEMDQGAAAVEAGPRLAAKERPSSQAEIYLQGLEAAHALAREQHGRPVGELSPEQVHDLVTGLRNQAPAFYQLLRMEVCALYLSDPAIWQRISFPGPSTQSGGYPDFAQPQTGKVTRLKEEYPVAFVRDPRG
jgi:hypothetical protein